MPCLSLPRVVWPCSFRYCQIIPAASPIFPSISPLVSAEHLSRRAPWIEPNRSGNVGRCAGQRQAGFVPRSIACTVCSRRSACSNQNRLYDLVEQLLGRVKVGDHAVP